MCLLFSLGCIFFLSISTICLGPPIWLGLFFKCEAAMSLQYSSQLWNAHSWFAVHAGHLPQTLPLTFQHSCTTDRGKSKFFLIFHNCKGDFSKKLLHDSIRCRHHLMHSWQSSIKRGPILTKGILSKILLVCANYIPLSVLYMEYTCIIFFIFYYFHKSKHVFGIQTTLLKFGQILFSCRPS